MLDHVFTDAIGALRDAFEAAFLERQAFEEHFQVDVLLGDITWETSYGLPGEGQPPRVVAHITFDWPTWSQTAYRRWYVDEVLDEQPAIEMEIVFRVQRLAEQPDPEHMYATLPEASPLIGDDRLERAGPTVEIGHHRRGLPTDADAASSTTPSRSPTRVSTSWPRRRSPTARASCSTSTSARSARGSRRRSSSSATCSFAFLPAEEQTPTEHVPARPTVHGDGRDGCRPAPTATDCPDAVAEDPVLLDVSERIATITLNRPDARNALSSEVLRLLPKLLLQADADADVDVHHPHRHRPGVLRRARPQGARLRRRQPRRRRRRRAAQLATAPAARSRARPSR